MRIYRHYRDVPDAFRGAVVALGNFDGVHRGHQALIGEARRLAKERSALLGVLAFEPHPQEFFRPSPVSFRLTPLRAKSRLIAAQGADVMYALHFDSEMASKSAEEFVMEVLIGGLGVRHVVVGADFQFGQRRTGNVTTLGTMGSAEGFGVTVFDPVAVPGHGKISSTRIRDALREGRPEEAAGLLGHWWTVEARVEHGDKRGRALGFPTANMRLIDCLKPAFGIYAARAAIMEDERAIAHHDGVANFGIRPMFAAEVPLLETFLFDFDADLYGRHLAVELIAYLRPEAKLESIEALKAQIAEDSAAARRFLAGAPRTPPFEI